MHCKSGEGQICFVKTLQLSTTKYDLEFFTLIMLLALSVSIHLTLFSIPNSWKIPSSLFPILIPVCWQLNSRQAKYEIGIKLKFWTFTNLTNSERLNPSKFLVVEMGGHAQERINKLLGTPDVSCHSNVVSGGQVTLHPLQERLIHLVKGPLKLPG